MKLLNKTTASLAFLIIVLHMVSSVSVGIMGDHLMIIKVKQLMFYSLPILIVAMGFTVISGKKLSLPIVRDNKLKWIAVASNAFIFLIPLSIVLYIMSQQNKINDLFYALETIEIICGSINIYLLIKIFSNAQWFNK